MTIVAAPRRRAYGALLGVTGVTIVAAPRRRAYGALLGVTGVTIASIGSLTIRVTDA